MERARFAIFVCEKLWKRIVVRDRIRVYEKIETRFLTMKYFVKSIQLVLILVPVVLAGWLYVENAVPSGTFIVKHSVQEVSPFIDPIAPRERVTEPKKNAQGEWYQTVTGDPAFFYVHPHRSFSSVDATIVFQNHDTPIVEFGALASKNPERYTLLPLQNLIIDQSSWPRLSEDGLLLLQRKPQYSSVQEFLLNPPSRDQIATYHADLSAPFRLSDYVASKTQQTIPVSLRGSFILKTYAKNEPLQFEFSYMDMNRDNGADPVSLLVTNEQGEPIAHAEAPDDGVVNTGKASMLKTVAVQTGPVSEGVYKLEFQTNRDIFVRSIQTFQQKIVFLNGVYLADEDGYKNAFTPVTFWTEAKQLSMQTRHAQSVQTVTLGTNFLSLSAPYQLMTTVISDPGLVPVKIEKGDVEVVTDAPIAFSQAQYFRPDPVRLLPHTDLDQLGVNYVLAHYTPPTEQDGWSRATVHLDTSSILLQNQDSWKFTFSTPEIGDLHTSVDVKEIILEMNK